MRGVLKRMLAKFLKGQKGTTQPALAYSQLLSSITKPRLNLEEVSLKKIQMIYYQVTVTYDSGGKSYLPAVCLIDANSMAESFGLAINVVSTKVEEITRARYEELLGWS